MAVHVVGHLEANANEESQEDGDEGWMDVPHALGSRERVPAEDHDRVLDVHDDVVEQITQARVPVDQVHVAEYIHECHDDVEEELLAARLAELCPLEKYPHEHDHPVDAGQDEHPVDERWREQRHRRNTGADCE